jgi:hypothetical protein
MAPGDDREVVEAQLGRETRAESTVVSRCHLGLPVVVMVPPILDDGTPFPTLYWLTCPLARLRVSRMESGGGVKSMEEKVRSNTSLAAAMQIAHQEYRRERDALIPTGAVNLPGGGVGGSGGGVKCLHAHYAHHAAGRQNPIGEMVATNVEPLDCTVPCVADGKSNPEWTAPA